MRALFHIVLAWLCVAGCLRGGRALPPPLQAGPPPPPPPVSDADLDTHLCQFYNETQCAGVGGAGGGEGGACQPEVERENCTATQAGKRSHCLTVWQLEGAGAAARPRVRIKGCFLDTVACERARPCRLHNAKLNLVHCCCQGDLCNLNATFPAALLPSAAAPPTPAPPPPSRAPHGEPPGEEARAGGGWRSGWAWALLALGLAGVAGVVGGAGVVGARYRRRRKPAACAPAAPPTPHLPSPILLLEVVARGRFGAVWRARMGGGGADGEGGEGEGVQVAVKVFGSGEAEASSWAVEREVLAALSAQPHPHVLPLVCAEVRAAGAGPREYWLVTAWRQHGNLHDYLTQHTLSYEQAARLAHTLAMGLAYLHEERVGKPAVAHRDFKSRNVLLNDDLSACIADFGLALVFQPAVACGDLHGQVGTRRYMPPEVLEGAINFTRDAFLRIDMYACALVLWELATRTRLPATIAPAAPAPAPAPAPYAPPFSELGAHPSLDEMQDAVVARKLRPRIPAHWALHPGMALLSETIEECWDGDAEARLSASCVLERLRPLAPAPPAPPAHTAAPAPADEDAAPLLTPD